MKTPPPARSLAQLVAGFRAVGLAAGDRVIVHSSCRSLGPVEGGAETVLDALIEAIGPAGNLMLPTFNYTRPLPEPYYDPAETPSRTGILPELGRRRPGAIRSLHPTHSVAVIGPDAAALTRDHHRVPAFGLGSPIDRLAQRDGKVLLLGVGHTGNSMIHVAEEHAGLPKVSWYDPLPWVKLRTPEGAIESIQLDPSASCSLAFGGAEGILRRHDEIRDERLGTAFLQLMRGRAVIGRVGELLREKPDHLLCTRVGCRPCRETRARLLLRERSGKETT